MHDIRPVVATLLALGVVGSGVSAPAARIGAEASPRQADALRPARTSTARAISRSTPHLKFTATITPIAVVPGARLSIVVDIVPKKGMHVYAPGSQYRPVAIRLQADPLFQVGDPVYPKPTTYRFKPLNEDVLVYDAPFRLVVDLTADASERFLGQLRGRRQVTIKGTLNYQACDDRMCYLPVSAPFQWTLSAPGE